MRRLLHGTFALSLLAALFAGCLGEAPHANPLDPNSDRFVNEGGLAGVVTDRVGDPLSDASVRLTPAAPDVPVFATQTNAQGRFQVRALPAGTSYRVRAEKPGFAPLDTAVVAVEAGQMAETPDLRLNALPTFADVRLRTATISRWWPNEPRVLLEVSAAVGDPDGLADVEGVWLAIPDFGFEAPLVPETGGTFRRVLDEAELPGASLPALLGRTLRLYAVDRQADTSATDPRQLARVITSVPVAASPSGDVLLGTDQPTLVWEPLGLPFPFTYEVRVFRREINTDVLLLTASSLPPTQTNLALETALPTGRYSWTVDVIDAFGNLSRSKDATFRVP